MKEEYIDLQTLPTIENLEDRAYRDAGSSGGNAKSFGNKLHTILSGTLLDESAFNSKSPEQIQLIQEEIDSLEQKVSQNEKSISDLQATVNANTDKISEIKETRDKYISGGLSKDSITDTVDVFNPIKFSISSFFLLMLSIFIFLFYVAIVYKALIMEDSQIAQQFVDGRWGVNVLPHWSEVQEAMRTNLMVIFAPFVFFGFGYAFHSLIGLRSNIKYLWIALVLIVTFALDYFLAERIHDKMNNALEIMGQPPNDKFSDILIVLILGFVVYIIWSVIFHAWMEELEKRNIPSRLGRIIKRLQKENTRLKDEISALSKDIELAKTTIRQKQKVLEIKSIPMSAIIKSLASYTHGWYRFITGLQNSGQRDQLINDCENTLKKFKVQNELSRYNFTIVDE